MATGAAEKGVLQVYERVFRPEANAINPGSIVAGCR
jgi:hypothetical protein